MPFKSLQLERLAARWYARLRGSESQIKAKQRQALQLTSRLRRGARVLDVASGPGYLAVEIARLARFDVAGLDISGPFVAIARENALKAGVNVDFRQGDVARMPFDDEYFDLVICQSAFKDFTQPAAALDEMFRVLRRGGSAIIQDMNSEASDTEIEREVRGMEHGRLNALITKRSLRFVQGRAHSRSEFMHLAAESAFRTCDIKTEGLGIDVRLKKRNI